MLVLKLMFLQPQVSKLVVLGVYTRNGNTGYFIVYNFSSYFHLLSFVDVGIIDQIALKRHISLCMNYFIFIFFFLICSH